MATHKLLDYDGLSIYTSKLPDYIWVKLGLEQRLKKAEEKPKYTAGKHIKISDTGEISVELYLDPSKNELASLHQLQALRMWIGDMPEDHESQTVIEYILDVIKDHNPQQLTELAEKVRNIMSAIGVSEKEDGTFDWPTDKETIKSIITGIQQETNSLRADIYRLDNRIDNINIQAGLEFNFTSVATPDRDIFGRTSALKSISKNPFEDTAVSITVNEAGASQEILDYIGDIPDTYVTSGVQQPLEHIGRKPGSVKAYIDSKTSQTPVINNITETDVEELF